MAKRGEHLHVIERAAERWGLVLTADDVRLLIQKIRSGECTEFEREGRRKGRIVRKVFVVIAETEIPVVFHQGRGHILTILPPEAAEVGRAIAKRSAAVCEQSTADRENGT